MQKEAMSKSRNKKGIALETLGYWMIAVAVLILLVVGYIILSKKGVVGINFIERLFRRTG
jgi:hypothetical protein